MPKWTKLEIKGLDGVMKRLQDSVKGFDQKMSDDVGEATKEAILRSLDKGISPIEGNGRFEEYLAAGNKNKAKRLEKKIRELKKSNKSVTGRLSQRFGFSDKVSKADLKTLKTKATNIKKDSKRGYPYNTKEYREGSKRPRPVNLFLKGDFWALLTWTMVKEGEDFVMKFGFLDEKNTLKEKGHRERAGGQPARPIIPIEGETYSNAIVLAVRSIFREHLVKWLKK